MLYELDAVSTEREKAEPGHIYPLIIFHPYEYQRLPLKIYAAAVCLKANVIEFNKSRFFPESLELQKVAAM